MNEAYNLEQIAPHKPKQNKEVVLLNPVDVGAEVADAVKALQLELAELRRLLRAVGGTAATTLADTKTN